MRIRRGELTDLYVEDERGVAMVGESVMVLSEIATSIVSAVPEQGTTTLDTIVASIVSRFGEPEPPDSAAELTLQHVHDLAAHHVLILEETVGTQASSTGSSDATDALRSALRHILSGDRQLWRTPADISDADFVAAARRHHVTSYLDRHRERLSLAPGMIAPISATATQRAAAVEILSVELKTAVDALDQAGVRVLVIKGLALAVQAHGDIAARGAGDVDLLVSPKDLERAHDVLTSLAWEADPQFPRPGPSWAWRHLKRTGYEVPLTGNASSIDLHWHLVPSAHTFPPFDVLWERRDTVNVGGQDTSTLSPYDALAHSASHAAKDQWRWMRSLVDVHALASDPSTWREVDRPLRGDQLLTLGVAMRMFGVSTRAPEVVHDSVRLANSIWSEVLATQALTASAHEWSRPLGAMLASSLRTTRLTGAGPRDVARHFGFSLLPPWLLASEESPHAWITAPQALRRRITAVLQRLTLHGDMTS